MSLTERVLGTIFYKLGRSHLEDAPSDDDAPRWWKIYCSGTTYLSYGTFGGTRKLVSSLTETGTGEHLPMASQICSPEEVERQTSQYGDNVPAVFPIVQE